ncbi:hypothetical protein MMC24_001039 [Lignoscripta atroalba]|nr:hypothetical protein [Lignoscripta atroalba]
MPSASRPQSSSSTAASPLHQPPALPSEILLLAESQWLFTEAELLLTPSILAGVPPAKERENRSKGVNFILQVGIMLKLPQITLATASILLHRFFMRNSMVDWDDRKGMHYYSVAATSLFLATKVEENCRKMKELVVACVRVAQKDPSKVVDEQDKEYWRWKDTILQLEDLLLEAICFDLSVEPPYKTLFDFLVFFGAEENKRLRNAAWAFVNDSCLTMLCLLFPSRTIAASALYAAAKHCGVNFSDDREGRPWWEVVGVELKSIRRACNFMAGVYENSPLRSGVEGSIYEKTPEDGDEWLAKTRARREGSEIGPRRDGTDRRNSTGSNIGSDEGSRKRVREEGDDGEVQNGEAANGVEVSNGDAHEYVDDIPWGGEVKEESGHKRRKVETNGTNGANAEVHGNGISASAESLQEDKAIGSTNVEDVSEEGEVEP